LHNDKALGRDEAAPRGGRKEKLCAALERLERLERMSTRREKIKQTEAQS
jgi:hypothetical protein